MAKRQASPVEITADSLQLHSPADVAAHVVDAPSMEGVASLMLPDVAVDDAPVPDHVDIGNWLAIHWRGRPIWRHKRTGQTLFKRDEVRRLRNLK